MKRLASSLFAAALLFGAFSMDAGAATRTEFKGYIAGQETSIHGTSNNNRGAPIFCRQEGRSLGATCHRVNVNVETTSKARIDIRDDQRWNVSATWEFSTWGGVRISSGDFCRSVALDVPLEARWLNIFLHSASEKLVCGTLGFATQGSVQATFEFTYGPPPCNDCGGGGCGPSAAYLYERGLEGEAPRYGFPNLPTNPRR